MFDAILGAVIIVTATSGLAMAVEVANRAMTSAGRHPLNSSELLMLRSAGLESTTNINKLSDDLEFRF